MADKPKKDNELARVETGSKAKLMAVTDQGIALRSVDDAIQFCTWCVDSGMLPVEINTPKKAFAIMARGAELGLKPFTSWRWIYMTKGGRLALESKGALAVCQSSPAFEDYQEGTEGKDEETKAWAIAKRKGRSPIRKEFTFEQAARAGLTGEKRSKEGRSYRTPWQSYLEDMLLSKARARALDVAFADVLGGMPIQGEAEDIDRAVEEREGGQRMPQGRDGQAPTGKDPLLDDLGPAKGEAQDVIDAQVREIFPKEEMSPEEELKEYEGEVAAVDEEYLDGGEKQGIEESAAPAECKGCGTLYHPDRAACPECGLAMDAELPPPRAPGVEEDANPFEKGRRQARKLKKKSKSEGQSSLLDK